MQQEEWQIVEPSQSSLTKKLALNFDRFNIVSNNDIVIDEQVNSHSHNEALYIDYHNEPIIYQSLYKQPDSTISPPFPLFTMSFDQTETRESSADKKAQWQSNPTQGPSMPYLDPLTAIGDTKTGQTLKQYEKNTATLRPPASSDFTFKFDPHLQPNHAPDSTSKRSKSSLEDPSKPTTPLRQRATEPVMDEQNKTRVMKKKKPILTEHKQPPVEIKQTEEEQKRTPDINKKTLSKCIQTSEEEFLAGIYLEIEKSCSITECYKLKSLNLNRQGITALNDLRLCFPLLEKLKVSHNELTQLSGLPETLYHLDATDNKLISIDLKRLEKLQRLYLSHNHLSQFDDLTQLKSLRTLDVAHNFIKSCKSFHSLEGLAILSLKSNNIRRLTDFEGFNNDCLESLDLSFNRIESLESIESLTGLRELNLDHNDIKVIQLTRPMERLCKLKFSFNRLKSIDMSMFPDIRILYLDDNQIERIVGAGCTKRLESFSLRDQGKIKVEINIQYLRGTRKLYLSGSPFRSLQQMVDFYSLEYLELCATDIEELPASFSKQMPNLGTLYLSANRIADIRPLRKLKYLRRLILIDNRITSLNEVIAVVKQLKNLNYLDLRQVK
ncbi:hypothetical protein G6F52_007157 [Rhizopus delemar]|nr:hypothetical protein G6F52_007157 [Rhizopus delemar]